MFGRHRVVATISDVDLAHISHCVLRPIIRVLGHDNLVVGVQITLAVVHAARDVEILHIEVFLTRAVNHAPLRWSSRGTLLCLLLAFLFSCLMVALLVMPAVDFARLACC